ncbi:hypothetical protein BCR44DRAFT_75248, partial [Catenaria anguillulae PL171]
MPHATFGRSPKPSNIYSVFSSLEPFARMALNEAKKNKSTALLLAVSTVHIASDGSSSDDDMVASSQRGPFATFSGALPEIASIAADFNLNFFDVQIRTRTPGQYSGVPNYSSTAALVTIPDILNEVACIGKVHLVALFWHCLLQANIATGIPNPFIPRERNPVLADGSGPIAIGTIKVFARFHDNDEDKVRNALRTCAMHVLAYSRRNCTKLVGTS